MSILLLFCVAVFIFAKVSNWKYKKSLYEHEDDLPKRRRVKKTKHIEENYEPTSGYTGNPKHVKYLHGEVVKTDEQYRQWKDIVRVSDRLLQSFQEAEYELGSCMAQEKIDSLRAECKTLYNEYRNYCLSNMLWNQEIGDSKPFTASADQLRAEEQIYLRIEGEYRKSQKKTIDQNVKDTVGGYILECLQRQKYQGTQKYLLVRYLRKRYSNLSDSSIQSAYNQLVSRGKLIQESYQGHVIVRIAPDIKQYQLPDLEERFQLPSEYSPEHFKNTDVSYYTRAINTVGEPINLDRKNHTCDFESKRTGEIYHTSLSRCSCPLYQKTRISPCKHMLKLAMRLGYETAQPGGSYGFGIH